VLRDDISCWFCSSSSFSDAYQFKGEKGDVRLSLNNDENKFNLGGEFDEPGFTLYWFYAFHA